MLPLTLDALRSAGADVVRPVGGAGAVLPAGVTTCPSLTPAGSRVVAPVGQPGPVEGVPEEVALVAVDREGADAADKVDGRHLSAGARQPEDVVEGGVGDAAEGHGVVAEHQGPGAADRLGEAARVVRRLKKGKG